MSRHNAEIGAGYRTIPPQNQRTRKLWNIRQLERIKYWHNVVQEDHIRKLWFDMEGSADTEYERMMLEEALLEKI